MRTITYKISDEVEALLEQEQQPGESLNLTARRLMTAYFKSPKPEVNQSIPSKPQSSELMSRLESLERLVNELKDKKGIDSIYTPGGKQDLVARVEKLGEQVEYNNSLLNEYMDTSMERSEKDAFERIDVVWKFRAEYEEKLEKLCDRVNALERNQPRPQPKKIEVGCKVLVSASATEKAIRSQSGEVVKSSGDGQWWVTIDKACHCLAESELIWLSAPPPPPEQKPEPKPEPIKLRPGDKIKVADIVPNKYAVHRGLTGRLEANSGYNVIIKTCGKTITIPRKYVELVPPEQKSTTKKSTGRRRKRTS